MERRRSYRKKVSLGAKLYTGNAGSNVFINNISKSGIFLKTLQVMTGGKLSQGNLLQLHFKTRSGKRIELQCRVKWSCRTPPLGLTDSVGMEIIDPPSEYYNFFSAL